MCRRVSRGSARSLAQGTVRVPKTGGGDVRDRAICKDGGHRGFDGAKYEQYELTQWDKMIV